MRRGNRKRRRKNASSSRFSKLELVILAVTALVLVGTTYYTFSRHEPRYASRETDTTQRLSDTLWGDNTKASAPVAEPVSAGLTEFTCSSVEVTDGDTFRCDDQRIRLVGIDAPELLGHCRQGRACVHGDPFASRQALANLLNAGTARCSKTDTDRYGRTIASCTVGSVNLSCELVRTGHAVKRYGGYPC